MSAATFSLNGNYISCSYKFQTRMWRFCLFQPWYEVVTILFFHVDRRKHVRSTRRSNFFLLVWFASKENYEVVAAFESLKAIILRLHYNVSSRITRRYSTPFSIVIRWYFFHEPILYWWFAQSVSYMRRAFVWNLLGASSTFPFVETKESHWNSRFVETSYSRLPIPNVHRCISRALRAYLDALPCTSVVSLVIRAYIGASLANKFQRKNIFRGFFASDSRVVEFSRFAKSNRLS